MQSDTYGYILLVAAMTITDVAKVETMNGTIDGKAVNGTTAYNYKNGDDTLRRHICRGQL